MMKTINAIILLLFLAQSVHAKIWRVNNNAIYTQGCTSCFSDLQDANNSTNVSPGDTIHLEASVTDYPAAIITKRLVIIGFGYFLNENGSLQQNIVSATVKGISLNQGADGSVMIGLRIGNNAAYSNININTNNVKVLRCYVESTIYFHNRGTEALSNIFISQCYVDYFSSFYFNTAPINGLIITNCYIRRSLDLASDFNNYSGVFAHNIVEENIEGSNGMKYYNNIFKGNNGFFQNKNSATNVYNNIFTNAVPAWLSSSSNINIAEATVFLSSGSTDGKLQLNPANICPQCYTGYPGTQEIGMFGGSTPYVLSSIPTIPTIYDLKGVATSFQGDTIQIRIGTRIND